MTKPTTPEALLAELDKAAQAYDDAGLDGSFGATLMRQAADLIAEQAAQLAAANARIAELGGALEPFAKAGGLFNDHFISLVYDPAAGDEYRLNSSHLIAARAALSQTDKGEG